MNTHADKTQENKSQSVANEVAQEQSGSESTFQFVDNRPEAVAQRKLQEMANNSPQVKQAAQLQDRADNYSAQQQQPLQKKENNTGLPDNLKTGMENLSGMSLDDVKVHRNSDKPAQLQAHAYAQGTDIHLGPGQEKHLPHEAWHVVQQKQGRVKPTTQMKVKSYINDDVGLEKEADVMGNKAFQSQTQKPFLKQKKEKKTSLFGDSSPIQPRLKISGAFHAGTSALGTPLTTTRSVHVRSMIDSHNVLEFTSVDEMMQFQDSLDTLLGPANDPGNIRETIILGVPNLVTLQGAVTRVVAAVPLGQRVTLLNTFNDNIVTLDRLIQLSNEPGFGTALGRLQRVLNENPGTARTELALTPLITAKKHLDQKVLTGARSHNPFEPASLNAGDQAQGQNLHLVGGHSDMVLDTASFDATPRGAAAANGARDYTIRKLLRNDGNARATAIANNTPGNIGLLATAAITAAQGHVNALPAPNVPPNLATLPAQAQAFWANRQLIWNNRLVAVNAAMAPIPGMIVALTASAQAVLTTPNHAPTIGAFVDGVRTLMQQVDNVIAAARQATTTQGVNNLPAVVNYNASKQTFLTHGPAMSITKDTTIPPVNWTNDQVLDAGSQAIQAPVRWVENYPLANNDVTQTLHQAVVASPVGGPNVVWSAVKDNVTYTTPPSAYTQGQVLGFWPTTDAALPPLPGPGIAVQHWYAAP